MRGSIKGTVKRLLFGGRRCILNCGDTIINQPQPLPENHQTWACPWTRIGHQ